MGKGCSSCQPLNVTQTAGYRRVLWAVFGINAVMFLVELVMSYASGSVSLLADSLDFLGDAGNYGISLFVLSASLATRAKASLLKGSTMGLFGAYVFITTGYRFYLGEMPNYHEMGLVGVLAFIANGLSVWLLFAFRDGDSNMRGVWLCSRNDMLGNLLVLLAAVAVYITQSNLPDLLVALAMVFLAIGSAWAICRQAMEELRSVEQAQ
ncbi:MAG: cation diffusion facilitator family transporter [Pasteurellaceae bacterium]|nr:cation diffusion facilitator family transporter [Pasteurellaceae bacterium]